MTQIVHDTPGHIDLRALTVLGVNAKPNSQNPIGYFGTGLKYAIAVLCRTGARVTVWIGDVPHEFYSRPVSFRGSDFSQLHMRRQRGVTRRWFTEQLPFTTQFGKNWELWQALRELHSNTLDEGGVSYAIEGLGAPATDLKGGHGAGGVHGASTGGVEGRTRIIVDLPAYAEAYANIDAVFLPTADHREARNGVQIIRAPARHLYYRGLRAYDTHLPTMRTWVFWGTLDLTEDRTLKYEFYAKAAAVEAVRQSTDRALIKEVLLAPDGTWEADLEFKVSGAPASAEFIEVAQLYGRRGLRAYVAYHAGPAATVQIPWQQEIILAMDGEPSELQKAVWTHKIRLKQLLERDLKVEEAAAGRTSDAEATIAGMDLPF